MNKFKNGFSLVELMIVSAMVGGVSLVVMQLGKSSRVTQVDAQNSADYNALQKEVSFLITNSCTASLKDVTTFNGSTIKTVPVTGLELWSANQTGARSVKKFYEGQDFGKIKINTISFSMPDYTGANYPAGTNQKFKGQIKISGTKTNLGKTKAFNDITQSIVVSFDTNAAGLSTIKTCSTGSGLFAPELAAGDPCNATTGNVAVDSAGALMSCQGGVWTASAGGSSEGSAKAYVAFNPSSCVDGANCPLSDSFGVASVHRYSYCDYQVNFSTPFATNGYAATFGTPGKVGFGYPRFYAENIRTTTSFRYYGLINEYTTGGCDAVAPFTSIVFFGH